MRTKARWTIAAVLTAGLIAVVATSCSSGSDNTVGASSAVGGGTKTVLTVAERKSPIELRGQTLEGKPLDLAGLRGKPVVLNIWGSWCAPCRKEAPDLAAAAAELGSKASFVGLNTREDDVAQAQAYQRRFKITYPSIVDHGDLLLALRGAISSQSPPVTLVLDAQGRIAGRFIGPVTRRTLVDMVQDVATSA